MKWLAVRLVLLAVMAVSVMGVERPNVVFVIADDLGWGDCPLYGGKDVRMPNLDRLAEGGMTFTHAFVASSSCAPSRAALLTGLDPIRNGAMLNHARPKAEIKKWPAYFKELGYETAAIGKVGHYAQTKEYGFDHASHFNFHQDDCVTFAVDWLTKRKSDKPLCLMVGTNWPHVPWPSESRYDAAKLTLPANWVDTAETRGARARYLEAVSLADRDLGLVMDAVKKCLGENTIVVFSADNGAQFPFGKWNCYDAGLHEPLVVSWPGKVKGGSRTDALVSWIDLLPTLVSAAGGEAPKGIDGRSFLPVLMGEAKDHREMVFGTHSGDGKMNRFPIRSVRTKDFLYVRNLDPSLEHHSHIDLGVARDGRGYWDSWVKAAETDSGAAGVVKRYFKRPAEELYDLSKDRWEMVNLAGEGGQAKRLGEMREALEGWMKGGGDLGMETERGVGGL